MIPWLIAIGVLGFLVLVHEWGHFVVARATGVKVVRFSIGFGPVLGRFTRGGTEYVISLIPLGGYVKMAGEIVGTGTAAPDEFLSKPASVRAGIIVAGPFVNYLTSVVALWTVFVIGYPELLPVAGRLMDDMPAKTAGLQVEDAIIAIDGAAVPTWEAMVKIVHRSADKPLQFEIERGTERLMLTITPKSRTIKDPFGHPKSAGQIGIVPSGKFATYKVPPVQAIGATLEKQWEWTTQTMMSLWFLFRGQMSPKESLTGPIGIMILTSEAAQQGISSLLFLVSLFSLSLAIFNLFPIPIMDGGHLLFLALEKLRGRAVSLKVQENAAKVSMAALLALVLFICVNDVQRFGLVDKVLGWWRKG